MLSPERLNTVKHAFKQKQRHSVLLEADVGALFIYLFPEWSGSSNPNPNPNPTKRLSNPHGVHHRAEKQKQDIFVPPFCVHTEASWG